VEPQIAHRSAKADPYAARPFTFPRGARGF
jgi:hypothetical protein